MRALLRGLLAAAAMMALTPSFAQAAAIIDFSTGSGGAGGTLVIGGNITGTGIFIDTVTITGAPINNGVFDVEGAGVCADAVGGCGLLNFDKNANTISIVGRIPALGILTNITLLSGNLSGGVTVLLNSGTIGSISASGSDTKSRELLIAIGLDPTTAFSFFGTQISGNSGGTGSPYTAVSTDILNTAVPDGGATLGLLGLGMLGLGYLRRRMK